MGTDELTMGKKPNKKDAAAAKAKKKVEQQAQRGAEAEAAESKEGVMKTAAISGILTSRDDLKDIEISHFSVANFGKELIQDATLTLTSSTFGILTKKPSLKKGVLSTVSSTK